MLIELLFCKPALKYPLTTQPNRNATSTSALLQATANGVSHHEQGVLRSCESKDLDVLYPLDAEAFSPSQKDLKWVL
jgi:hypothetical protein